MGRPRKPTRIHELNGNPSRLPLNRRREPEPPRGRPTCPSWLSKPAKREWARLVKHLDRLGLITLVDGAALSCMCQAVAEHEEATREIEKSGRWYSSVTEGGVIIRPHPAVAMQRSAWKAIKDFCSLFGLDPADRSRLAINETAAPEDELESVLKIAE
jgi:P27 family predicted phage terminase small subunit